MKKITIPKINVKKVKKKWIISGVIIVLVILVGSHFFFMRSRMNKVTQGNSKISTTVTTSTIQTSVSGTGSISYADTTDIVVPSSLSVDELLVSEGSTVAEGEVIATVDEASLALCLSEVEDAIAEVDDTISSESSSSTSQTIKAGVAGRVKKIYADEDDNVVDIMKEQGKLMLLSADDLMMVTLTDATSLTVGDEVVVSSGETTTDGTVESVGTSGTVITFDDSVFAYEEEVTVTDSEGATIGTGKAYIHQEISVVASSGIISSLNVSLNSNVSASTNVFTLTSSAKSAEYMQAVKEREQLVSLLNTLVTIQVNGGITAPVDGMLQTVNTSSDSSTGSSGQSSSGFMMGATEDSYSNDTMEMASSGGNEAVATGITQLSAINITQVGTMESVEESVVDSVGTSSKTPATAPFGLTGSEGFIYGTTVDMEYADKEDATEWKACTADKTAVAAGIWYVRVKETDIAGASAAVKVEVQAAGTSDSKQNQDTTQNSDSQQKQDTTQDNSQQDNDQQQKSNQNNTTSSEDGSEQGSKDDETATSPNGETDKANSNQDKTDSNTSGGSSAGGGASVSRSGSSSSTTATTTSTSLETTNIFTIANGDKMMVTMNVDELDIGTMQVGLEAEITLDAIENETFTGQIVSVSGNASSSGGSTQYPVEIVFDKTDAMLSGMNASVEVIVEQAENVLVIPLSAIQDDGTYSYVYTKYDESTDMLSGKVQVEIGLSDETNVEITTGLSEGDTVYYEMQGSEDSTSRNSGMGGFTMPGGMNMPGGDFPGGDMRSGSFDGKRQNGGNRGGMGGQ